MKNVEILVIDDDLDVLHTARIILKPHYATIMVESNPAQIRYLLNQQQFNVILLDMNFTTGATGGQDGLSWLKVIKEINHDQQVIMMTAYGDIKLAVEAMKVGAADFIVKPWENEKFLATIQMAYEHSKSKAEIKMLKTQQSSFHQMLSAGEEIVIGQSAIMQNVINQVKKVAVTDANVLILGENGTGKEEIAKLIHKNSDRKRGPFIKVDLGAITESLFETELFGHLKGAFTDAKEDKIGRFALSQGGTLFLDEIGNMSLSMQSKLLSVLQNKEVIPVGGSMPIVIENRIIAATNADLQQQVADKNFREDLLYRLNTVVIVLPPLRERMEDLSELTQHFLSVFNHKYGKNASVGNQIIDQLKTHSWPGNIRELMHSVERAIIMSDHDILTIDDFLLNQNTLEAKAVSDTVNLDEIEKSTIERALKKYDGNISKAAKELGLGRTTIYRKMDKYGINY
jgi:two-component system response regulator HydG